MEAAQLLVTAIQSRDLQQVEYLLSETPDFLVVARHQALPAVDDDTLIWFWRQVYGDDGVTEWAELVRTTLTAKLLQLGLIPGRDFSHALDGDLPVLLLKPQVRLELAAFLPIDLLSSARAIVRVVA